MTRNQLTWMEQMETKRSNLAREKETNRANMANESQARLNYQEQVRSNLERERENRSYNSLITTETRRSNLAREALTHEGNLLTSRRDSNNYYLGLIGSRNQRYASELNARSAIAVADRQVSENRRHNQAMEAINDAQQRSQAAYNRASASATTMNAYTNRYAQQHQKEMDLYLTPYKVSNLQSQTDLNSANRQYVLSKDSMYPVELGYGFLNSMSGFTRSIGGAIR